MTASPRRSKLAAKCLKPFRFLGTAIAFGLFGASGMLFRFGITPWLNLTEKDALKRVRISRFVVWRWFGIFVSIIRSLGLVRVEVKNPERLERKGLIIAANHPSLIDVVCLISRIPQATTIVKASLAKNWFTAPPVRAAGYATYDLGPEALEQLEADAPPSSFSPKARARPLICRTAKRPACTAARPPWRFTRPPPSPP